MEDGDFVSTEALERLTGAKRADVQARILTAHGIYFIERRDGSIVTTWHHVHRAPDWRVQNSEEEPAYNAVGG